MIFDSASYRSSAMYDLSAIPSSRLLAKECKYIPNNLCPALTNAVKHLFACHNRTRGTMKESDTNYYQITMLSCIDQIETMDATTILTNKRVLNDTQPPEVGHHYHDEDICLFLVHTAVCKHVIRNFHVCVEYMH